MPALALVIRFRDRIARGELADVGVDEVTIRDAA